MPPETLAELISRVLVPRGTGCCAIISAEVALRKGYVLSCYDMLPGFLPYFAKVTEPCHIRKLRWTGVYATQEVIAIPAHSTCDVKYTNSRDACRPVDVWVVVTNIGPISLEMLQAYKVTVIGLL